MFIAIKQSERSAPLTSAPARGGHKLFRFSSLLLGFTSFHHFSSRDQSLFSASFLRSLAPPRAPLVVLIFYHLTGAIFHFFFGCFTLLEPVLIRSVWHALMLHSYPKLVLHQFMPSLVWASKKMLKHTAHFTTPARSLHTITYVFQRLAPHVCVIENCVLCVAVSCVCFFSYFFFASLELINYRCTSLKALVLLSISIHAANVAETGTTDFRASSCRIRWLIAIFFTGGRFSRSTLHHAVFVCSLFSLLQ